MTVLADHYSGYPRGAESLACGGWVCARCHVPPANEAPPAGTTMMTG